MADGGRSVFVMVQGVREGQLWWYSFGLYPQVVEERPARSSCRLQSLLGLCLAALRPVLLLLSLALRALAAVLSV